jgi:glycosyltransferase involved in cell wall biosynthesis
MISVIVCTYNRCKTLSKTLSSLSTLVPPIGMPWELILVDNRSTDDTAAVIKGFIANSRLNVRYLFERDQGLSYARNSAIRAARGRIIAFTDDDVTLDTRWLCEIQVAFEERECIGAGGRILPVWTSQKPSWLTLSGPHSLRTGTIVSFDQGEDACDLMISPVGANMAFKMAAFEKYGFFRTDLGKRGSDPMIGEETEFCTRLTRAGEKIRYAPKAIVYHPVPMLRLRKRHFQSHYFNYGRYLARINGFPEDAIPYFGVPRYLLRDLLGHCGRWLFDFDTKTRFNKKLQLFERLGEICEARRMSTERKQGSLEASS